MKIVTEGRSQSASGGSVKYPPWARVLEAFLDDTYDWIYATVAREYGIDLLRLETDYPILKVVKLWAMNAHYHSPTPE